MNESAKQIVALLTERGETVAFAESCTGGLIAKTVTDVPGASEVFGFGFVTYANEAKQRLLGVSAKVLRSLGAVSGLCAAQMCRGARAVACADYAVSVTGIAGPGGGTAEKPVGLVYVGIASARGVRTKKLLLHGTREEIRSQTAEQALAFFLRELQRKD